MKQWVIVIAVILTVLLAVIFIPLKSTYEISAQLRVSPLVAYRTLAQAQSWKQWYAWPQMQGSRVEITDTVKERSLRYRLYSPGHPVQEGDVQFSGTPDGGVSLKWRLQLKPGWAPAEIRKAVLERRTYADSLRQSILALMRSWERTDTLTGIPMALMQIKEQDLLVWADTIPALHWKDSLRQRSAALQQYLEEHGTAPAGHPVARMLFFSDSLALEMGIPVQPTARFPVKAPLKRVRLEPGVVAVGRCKGPVDGWRDDLAITREWARLHNYNAIADPWIVYHDSLSLDILQPVFVNKQVNEIYE